MSVKWYFYFMVGKQSFLNSTSKEVIFQILLHIVLFLFFSFDKNQPEIKAFKIIAFLNYSLGALVINYILLPHFFYRKRYFLFFVYVVLVVSIIIMVEELVLERVFYPTTRGRYFPGVIFIVVPVINTWP